MAKRKKTRKGYTSKGERPNVSKKHKTKEVDVFRLIRDWKRGKNPGLKVTDENGNTVKVRSEDYWRKPPRKF